MLLRADKATMKPVSDVRDTVLFTCRPAHTLPPGITSRAAVHSRDDSTRPPFAVQRPLHVNMTRCLSPASRSWSGNFSARMSVVSHNLMTWPFQAIPQHLTGHGVTCSGI